MFDWFSTLAAGSELPMDATSELQERGFVIIPGPARPDQLANAYTAAVALATSDDIRIGSTSTKVNDFVNRGAVFDSLYTFTPRAAALSADRSSLVRCTPERCGPARAPRNCTLTFGVTRPIGRSSASS